MADNKNLKVKVTVNNKSGVISLPDTFTQFMSELKKKITTIDNTKKYSFETNVNNNCEFYDDQSYNIFKTFYLKNQEEVSKTKLKITGSILDTSLFNLREEIENIFKKEFKDLENSISQSCSTNILSEQKKLFENEKRARNVHRVCCKECFRTNFEGIRYLCAECDNFNICETCERRKPHKPDHILIRISGTIEQDQESWSSDFIENDQRRLIKFTKDSEKVFEVKMINDGIYSWIKSFLLPIAYGEKYVWGKKVEIPNTAPNDQVSVKLKFDVEPNKKGRFTSKWRLFKENGIPFGKILEFEVEIE